MLRVSVVFLIGLLLFGCSGEESTVTPENNPPTITFGTNRIVIRKGVAYDLSVNVSDADGDPLTVTWRITSSTLTPQNAQNTIMRWATPGTVGTDTVWVTVSDGKATASVEEIIKRGTLSTSTVAPSTYSKSSSPWILAPDNSPPSVLISGGTTTVIEAGVELYIDGPESVIDVLGRLESNGTEGEPVLIRPNDRRARCGDTRGWWEGIQGWSEDLNVGIVDFTYTEIRSAEFNVRLTGTAQAYLEHCKIACGRSAGVRITGSGILYINNCDISDCAQNGIEVSSVSSIPSAVTITNNEIQFNNDGIYLDLPDVMQTLMIDISYNLIKDNWVNGISFRNSVFATVRNNHISRNNWGTTSNIRLVPPYPGTADVDTLHAEYNYWGAAYTGSGSTIEATITDSADNAGIGTRVNIHPWVNTSPLP